MAFGNDLQPVSSKEGMPKTFSEDPRTRTQQIARVRNFQINQPIMADTSRWQTEMPREFFTEIHEMLEPYLRKYDFLKSAEAFPLEKAG